MFGLVAQRVAEAWYQAKAEYTGGKRSKGGELPVGRNSGEASSNALCIGCFGSGHAGVNHWERFACLASPFDTLLLRAESRSLVLRQPAQVQLFITVNVAGMGREFFIVDNLYERAMPLQGTILLQARKGAADMDACHANNIANV